MPYIKSDKRLKFKDSIDELIEDIENVGDLDYCITTICNRFIKKFGRIRFENMAKVAGTILFVILENYRRMTVPYEDKKKIENGDVYDDINNPRLNGEF